MAYADITRLDRNPIKRFLQGRRLNDAIALIPTDIIPQLIVDFGAGDGELSKKLVAHFGDAKVVCYEPAPTLRAEATVNLKGTRNVVVASRLDELLNNKCELLFCLEVFEHLPLEETREAILSIQQLLTKQGVAVIGVPIEIFGPALLKGLFRMARRCGEFDARFLGILLATLGAPPRNRPVAEIAPGLAYHYRHLGFDHRRLRIQLEKEFQIVRTVCSPLKWLGTWMNSEVNYVLRKSNKPIKPTRSKSRRAFDRR